MSILQQPTPSNPNPTQGEETFSLHGQLFSFRWVPMKPNKLPYTWNRNDLHFCRSTPKNKAFSNQNKGHLGSRYIDFCDYKA